MAGVAPGVTAGQRMRRKPAFQALVIRLPPPRDV